MLARRKARRLADPERYRVSGREQMRRWRATNPRRSPYHGLSPEEVSERLAQQGGVCGLCKTESTKRWHGDHDHKTGAFRGVLCNKCNMGLGLFNDNVDLCQAAVAYLERHAELQKLF